MKKYVALLVLIVALIACAAAAQDAPADPVALIQEGKALLGQGDAAGAEAKLLEAVALAEQSNNTKALQFSYMLLVKLYTSTGNIDKAVEFNIKAAGQFEGIPKYLSALYLQIGNQYYSLSKYGDAITYYEKAREQYALLGDASYDAVLQGNIATSHINMGEYAAAETVFTSILDGARAAGNATDTIRALRSIGEINYVRADFDAALSTYNEALALAEQNARPGEQIMIWNSIAVVGIAVTDLDASDAALKKALALAEQAGDMAGQSATEHQLGVLLTQKGDVSAAIEHFAKALELKTQLKDQTVSATLAEMGRAYYFSGNYKQARKYYNDALKAGMPAADAIRVRNNLAMVYKMQGQYDYALAQFEQSLEDARRFGLRSVESALLNNIGITLRDMGDPDRALPYHEQALTIDSETGEALAVVVDMNNIAMVHKLKLEYDPAMELLTPALADARGLGAYDDLLRTLNNLGEVQLLKGDTAAALAYFEEAAALAEKTANPERQWNALFGAGRAHEAAGDLDKAVELYKKAVEVIEGLRAGIGGGDDDKSHFLRDKVKVFMQLIKILFKLNRFDEALEYLERMKARSLLDLLQKGRADINNGMAPEQVQNEKDLKRALADATRAYGRILADKGADSPEARAAKEQLDAAKTALDAFKNQLYAGNPALAFARGESKPVTAADLRAALRPDEVIVAYMLTGDTSYAWTITRDAVKMYDLGIAGEKIDFQVDAKLRESLEKGVWQKSQQRAANKLYQTILQPLDADFAGKTVMGLLPDGRLYELPFYLLLDDNDVALIDKLAVYTMPSLSVMVETRRAQAALKNQDTVLAFGNPTFARADLVQLPGTEVEVGRIIEVYGDRARVHFHEDALEDHIKRYAGGYRIIHLATHGLLNNNNPLYSSIAMSGIAGQPDDGFLEAREIPIIKLDAELVILSACESGRGRMLPGEGILGLTRSLFSAGVPGIIASMWEVNDQATAFMMREFYSQYPAVPAVEALRRAQIATRAEFGDNPNLWAPFVLMGFGVPAGGS